MSNASLVSDASVARAVSGILSRSERQPDVDLLEKTYVDTGVLPQLDNANNQILYGRRGTGKSHVLRVLGAKAAQQHGSLQIYIDVRCLGSAHMMTDSSLPASKRCVAVYKDLLSLIQSLLLDVATDPDSSAYGDAFDSLSGLADVITRAIVETASRDIEENLSNSDQREDFFGLEVGANSIKLSAGGKTSGSDSASMRMTYGQVLKDTVIFAEVARSIDDALKDLKCDRLFIMLDEWTTIPADIQPYIAEFLKRTIFPSQRVTLKIASLEYRSSFSVQKDGNFIGFELGGDIAANLDLDDYYVYDRSPERVVDMFRELTYRHLQVKLGESALMDFGVNSPETLTSKLFTEPATFVELVRAGEGVVRDFLGIFASAFFRAMRSGRMKIDVNSVEEAARDWYETDKAVNLSPAQSVVLHKIMSDVIGNRQAKSFMLARQLSTHPMIQSLFDLRLIHLILRGYSDKENPGLRYNIYSLDYGTYVDLKRTKSAPELTLAFPEIEPVTTDRIVPFADKRSIRRVILDPAILNITPEDARSWNYSISATGHQSNVFSGNINVNSHVFGQGNDE